MYEITNNGTATRIFHNSSGRPVNVRSGETLSVMLTDEQKKRVCRDAALSVREPPGNGPKLPPPDHSIYEMKSTAERATALLDMSSGKMTSFTQFFVNSKELLGDKWPGGTPKKSVIRELLLEFLSEQEQGA